MSVKQLVTAGVLTVGVAAGVHGATHPTTGSEGLPWQPTPGASEQVTARPAIPKSYGTPAEPGPQVEDPAPNGPCAEDEPCWDPRTMGNGQGSVPQTTTRTTARKTVRLADGSVVVMDETGGAYPVSAAIAAWGIPGVREGTCTPGTAGCVVVRTVSSLTSPGPGKMTEGRTTWSAPGDASVRLSTRTAAADRLHVAVHELGHAFGLQHSSGVMGARDDHRTTSPSAAQRAAAMRDLGR